MSTFQHTIPPSTLEQIGDMTVSFGHLEFQMRWVFTYLVNQSAIVGAILASPLSFRSLRDVLSSLYKERFGENKLYSELEDLLKEAAKLEQERNAITHSEWLAGNRRHKITSRQKGGVKFHLQEYSEKDLPEFNQRIKRLTGQFIDFYKKLPDRIPAQTE